MNTPIEHFIEAPPFYRRRKYDIYQQFHIIFSGVLCILLRSKLRPQQLNGKRNRRPGQRHTNLSFGIGLPGCGLILRFVIHRIPLSQSNNLGKHPSTASLLFSDVTDTSGRSHSYQENSVLFSLETTLTIFQRHINRVHCQKTRSPPKAVLRKQPY